MHQLILFEELINLMVKGMLILKPKWSGSFSVEI
jgi:hypothetical protein